VSSISWNRVNPDLVAVGYGQFQYMKQKGGLVCCWSIKNPEFPERLYQTASGVMCVDFSKAHPNLLAAGLHDGTIAIFNVGMATNEPVLDSCEAPGKHTSPVWHIQWIEKERGSADEHTEVLVSVSTDGRVTQWAIRKGFESYDLMKLKRITEKQTTQNAKTKKNDAMISKFAGGYCFDFSAKDSNIYLVGTEDGHIHRCSCSYNEQYLDSYFGHTGPVYTVKWSPFDHNVFLSSSGDWSVRLWHQDRLQPVLNLFSSTKAVPNFCWSPKCSTVFACVNEGALEVWDLSQNTLDPVLVNIPSSADVKLSAVSFARNTECLLVGDSEGQVIIYQLRGMSPPRENQIEALQQVMNSSLASQLKK
jgi:WD40 repeat protein